MTVQAALLAPLGIEPRSAARYVVCPCCGSNHGVEVAGVSPDETSSEPVTVLKAGCFACSADPYDTLSSFREGDMDAIGGRSGLADLGQATHALAPRIRIS